MNVSFRLCPRVLACTIAIATSAFPGAAGAQEETAPPAKVHRVGPFTVSPTVTLRDFGVDSNVYNATHPVSDFTFTVAPVVNATTRVRRAIVTLHSATDLVYFARQTTERSVNEQLSAGVRVPLGRIAFTGAASYLNTRQRPTEEIDARSRRVGRGAEAGVTVAVTPKLSAGVKAGYAKTAFDADAVFDNTFLAEELNRNARTLTGSVTYAATRLTSLSVSSVMTRTKFVDAPVRDADTRELLFGVELHPRALVSGGVTAGYQHFEPRSAHLPDLRGLVGTGALSFRLDGATAITVEGGRGIDYSYFEDQPYYVREGYSGSIRRYLLRGWDVQLAGSRFNHRYRRNADAPEIYAGTDRLLQFAVVTGYQVSPAARFTVGLTYLDRRSPFPGRSYDSLRLGTAVSYAF